MIFLKTNYLKKKLKKGLHLESNVPSKSLLSVRGMKGRVSSGGYLNLGTQGKEVLVFSPKIKVFSKKKKRSSF